MAKDELTQAQLDAVVIVERVGSVFSLLGCVVIIATFSLSKAFHKPINRLVFYASFGNMMTNIATLMAREYLDNINSFGCQFQAFLIQMFMPADACWTLAMAFNVYLTFYFKYDAEKLRQMEKWYILLCYGVPFIPALVYIFVSNRSQGRMYGNATIWCWVSSKWDVWRITTFYGPVWVVIVITFAIYIRAGGQIYRKRKQLKYFGSTTQDGPEPLAMDDPYSVKTTEIQVTTELANNEQPAIDLAPLGRRGSQLPTEQQQGNAQYSVTISSNARDNRRSYNDFSLPIQSNVEAPRPPTIRPTPKVSKRRAAFEANNAAWSYTKCAILFFTAILVTWIPSSANRVYSVIHTDEVSWVLEVLSALVLPLQGFWNAVIYIVTSWRACKIFVSDICNGSIRSDDAKRPGGFTDRAAPTFTITGRAPNRKYDSESMTELALSSRPESNDERKLSV